SVALGSVTVTAVFNGVTGTTTHTISNASLVSLAIAPAPVSVAQGASVTLVATGSYSDGSTQDLTTSVTWSSSATGVAQVSNASGSQGLVTGVSPGSTVVTALSGSVSQTVNVTVTP
ncbi:MAG: Ig-like domain-containing protein, partial [Archangium sp.]|nr:Ig-like domain-containing protein [Archangium sp.]